MPIPCGPGPSCHPASPGCLPGRQEFDAYVEWLRRNGPYDVLIDGANVAFFGQNHEGGGFNWSQVRAMYKLLRQQHPGKKILLVSPPFDQPLVHSCHARAYNTRAALSLDPLLTPPPFNTQTDKSTQQGPRASRLISPAAPPPSQLQMLHRKRVSGPDAQGPGVQAFLAELRATKSFYYTPHGANDDWCVGCGGLRGGQAGAQRQVQA